jgi:hypothetical protein
VRVVMRAKPVSPQARPLDFDALRFGGRFVVAPNDRHKISAAEQRCELLVVLCGKPVP